MKMSQLVVEVEDALEAQKDGEKPYETEVGEEQGCSTVAED